MPAPSSLVTAIMPTCNRRPFVSEALAQFLAQDYPHKELLVLDDGEDSVADLIPDDPQVHYLCLPARLSVGAKRNRACELASGNLIAHWDDDDWHAPQRLSLQVAELEGSGAEVVGLQSLYFYDPLRGLAWRYSYPTGQRFWLSGSSLCFRRSYWQAHRFPDLNVGEDARFVWAGDPARMRVMADDSFHVGRLHAGNVSPKPKGNAWWQALSLPELPPWFLNAAVIPAGECPGKTFERSLPMTTLAHTADLDLPEFLAYRSGQALPFMRRWEGPFVLSQLRLKDGMRVLDLSINPAGFGERLVQLYPYTLYRHHNPYAGGRLDLPLLPEHFFDRVVCVNTLEHLVRADREALMGCLARALRPEGQVILTSDAYFDDSRHDPRLIAAGLVRADGSEVSGGFNVVTALDWVELGAKHGLSLLGEPAEAPKVPAPEMLLNTPPYVHGCLGGVLAASGSPADEPGRHVVLGLLSWNTRDITLEAVQAHAREARMLRRLGQQATLVICDNGSDDGTSAQLKALLEQLDLPYTLILNPKNRGNSLARNQLIEAALTLGGDYLLFMDGDIEVVPCSSFAMLRHMEASGPRLGCLGADSRWQTPLRAKAAQSYFCVPPQAVTTARDVAWTQYGLFRREVFDAGVRFDESAPFDGAGWGYEDNDLAFQMDTHGYLIQSFSGMTYLHRAARSSVRNLQQAGYDAQALCEARRQFVIHKWQHTPGINSGPLEPIRQYAMKLI